MMLSAIYKITCLKNQKIYIGSSKNYKNRWITHKRNLKNNKHVNKYMQSSWNKYGRESFEFSIVEYCDIDNLLDRENYWIKKLDSFNREHGFNMSPVASHYDQSKEYIVISPDGEEFHVKNLESFCIEQNLEKSSLHKVANGELNQYKNWYCRHKSDSHKDWLKKRKRGTKSGPGWKGKYRLTHKDGTVLIIDSLNKFCLTNNYRNTNFWFLEKGIRKSAYGYIKIEKCEL